MANCTFARDLYRKCRNALPGKMSAQVGRGVDRAVWMCEREDEEVRDERRDLRMVLRESKLSLEAEMRTIAISPLSGDGTAGASAVLLEMSGSAGR